MVSLWLAVFGRSFQRDFPGNFFPNCTEGISTSLNITDDIPVLTTIESKNTDEFPFCSVDDGKAFFYIKHHRVMNQIQ